MRRLLLAFGFLSAVAIAALGQSARHPFAFDDAANLRSAQAVAVSPDGKNILYQVRFGSAKGPDKTEWHLIAPSGGESRHLDIPENFKPTGFTRDGGALYGVYQVNKVGQLATLTLAPANTPAAAAATPLPLTALPRGVHSALISPDGSQYAVLGDPRLPDPLQEVHTVIEAQPTSLYVVGANGSGGSWWCPAIHDISDIAWSNDGSSIAVLSLTPKIGYHSARSFIDVCGASGPRHVATLENIASGIGWTGDGKELSFSEHNFIRADCGSRMDRCSRRRNPGRSHSQVGRERTAIESGRERECLGDRRSRRPI